MRTDEHANRFQEVTINGPKSWSLVAALIPEVAAATFDLYGHLMRDRLDVVADAMDASRGAALAARSAPPVPAAAVVVLDTARQAARGR